MSQEIAQQWLDESANTANTNNLNDHMNLISKRVALTGVPGFDSIGYDDWFAQCQHEFTNHLLKSVAYKGLKLIVDSDTRIMFKTYETVTGTNNETNAQGIEVLIEKEQDGVWRLTQERVLSEQESAHDQLI
ncbi:MAG: hypothetical protein ACN4GM_00455 [Gammaproteobacteria bacterium]